MFILKLNLLLTVTLERKLKIQSMVTLNYQSIEWYKTKEEIAPWITSRGGGCKLADKRLTARHRCALHAGTVHA